MKRIFTLYVFFTLAAIALTAQTTYTVNSNTSYSANCNNCIFNIAASATLTINNNGTCNNCTFNGGNIKVQNDITCQPCSFAGNNIALANKSINPNSGTTSFTNVILTSTGNGGINANTPVDISNSTFTFTGNSVFFNNGGTLDISNSKLYFNGSSSFLANAGPVNLRNASTIVAGDGTLSSAAFIKMNGAVLNLYDAGSSIKLSNLNNYYFNWSAFNSVSNNKTYPTTYPSSASTLNCGGTGQHACGMWSSPTVYGPAGFNSSGVASTSSLLPVVLSNFTVARLDGRVTLGWTTAQEINAAYFGVERSADGGRWEQVAKVAANGNSAIPARYNYVDAGGAGTTTYYRLALVDYDGKKVYSDIKVLRQDLIQDISFYPNPATDNIKIALASNSSAVTVKLVSLGGQVIQEQRAGNNAAMIVMNVQQVPHGLYVLKLTEANGTEHTAKMMIAR